MSRTEVATELAGGVEGSKVRAKMWSEKLLSRVPTDPELTLWGGQIQAEGDLAVVTTIAGSGDYLLIAQERMVESTLTTAPGTVVVTGAEVISAVYAPDGSGTVVLAAGVTPPAVGRHLVVSNDTDPAAGGIGQVTTLAPGPGGQSTVQVIAAGLADAFASGETVDTTEMVDPIAEAAPAGRGAAACNGGFSWGDVRADIGIDPKNDSSIKWSWNNFNARIAAKVTPRMSVTLTGLTVSGSCSKELWSRKWNAPIQAGPVTIPGYFRINSTLGVSGEASAFEMTGSMSIPCTIGVKATKSSVSNVSGCSRTKSSLTVTPTAEASVNISGDIKVGYFLGADGGGWFKAYLGMAAGLEAGIEAEARLVEDPGWEVDAYLDANLDLEGGLGRWDLDHNLANRRLKTWRIADGELGHGTPDGGTYQPGEDSIDPPAPPSPMTATAIAVGETSTCSLNADTTVACWGDNQFGQIGDGTTFTRLKPTPVIGLTGVAALSSGGWHSCALKQDSTVACWGSNEGGQLGDGTTTDRATPTAVAGLTGVTAVSTGHAHSCALRQNATVACWGFNYFGQLGLGHNGNKKTPSQVAGLTGVTAISARGQSTCALKQDATVTCWGDNEFGQVGDGTTTNRWTPTQVGGLTGVAAITAGYEHSCALKQNATAACWGGNGSGQLGDGTTTNRVTPTVVVGLAGVTAISSSCALKQDATVACWGPNSSGQIGDGTTTDRLTPTAVVGLTGATVISSSGSTACALAQDDSIACWGYNQDGQLGNGTTTNRSIPTAIVRS